MPGRLERALSDRRREPCAVGPDLPSGQLVVVGRPSTDRDGWEAARAADADDLNAALDRGAEIEAMLVDLPGGDAERCLEELRSFGDVPVYVRPKQDLDAVAMLLATGEGIGLWADSPAGIHAAVSLDVPFFTTEIAPECALAMAALVLDADATVAELERLAGAPELSDGIRWGALTVEGEAVEDALALYEGFGP